MRLITTAGSFAHPSFKLLEHAKSNDLWRVHEIEGPAPWQDSARIAEQRSRLPDAIASQLLDNRWTEASGAFLSADDLAACFALEGPSLERDPRHSYFAGVDLGLKNDATAVAVGHREDEVVKLDRLMVWKGSRVRPVDMMEVEAAILDVHKTYRPKILCDPWQSEGMVQRLKRQGVRAEMFTFSATSKMHLAQGLLTAVGDHVLKLYDAPGLRDELARLKLKQSPTGLWTFDHGSGRGDHDDMAMAISLMLQASLTRNNRKAFSVAWNPYNDGSGPATFEDALAEAKERRDDARRIHGAEGHAQWCKRNFCQECYDQHPDREHERIIDEAIAKANARPRQVYVKDLGVNW